ncbi:hypothetical protein DH2020_029420 [Rehmannia glutinosa]|uniref:Ankyrin repeat domain-containing protein n=1 Tax=Rehmannia glutinosa TaxID=99300 RepID=A0ABR0VSP8_REHGL
MSSAASSSSTILTKSQAPVIFSLLHTSPLSISTPRKLHFPPLTRKFLINSSKSPNFSSQPPYGAVSPPQPEEEEEEESAIGDCLVYEEGIFDDPFLQNTRHSRNDDVPVSKFNKSKDTTVAPENLIPEKWLDVQREINISKKERRKISQQLEYGKRVEKRRQALMPIYSEEYEKFKNEKLQQLKPLVLDKPEPPEHLEEDNKYEKRDDERSGEVVASRVAPRNPRMAVYGGGLEDISALFSSGSYEQGGAAEKSQGTRKLFSKEEKVLMNRRVPDLTVAISGKWHPLHTLAASGEFYLVNSLLKHNLDINAPDKNGLTAIHKAILGRKQANFILLRESANPFVRDSDGATLMHYAVFSASTQMIKILLLYNVDINLQDNDGWTALHLAVQSRRTDIVRLLLIKGADKSLENRNGFTALDLCLYSGRDTRTYEIIKLLKTLP